MRITYAEESIVLFTLIAIALSALWSATSVVDQICEITTTDHLL